MNGVHYLHQKQNIKDKHMSFAWGNLGQNMMLIDKLTFVYTACLIGFSTQSQKAKHIVMHGGIEQVTTVSSIMALMLIVPSLRKQSTLLCMEESKRLLQ